MPSVPSGNTDNTVAIISVLTSGVVTPSIVAWYALRARRRDERRIEREHQVTLLEEALNAVNRESSLLQIGFSTWRHGLTGSDHRVQENDRAVAGAIEAVWLTNDKLRIRFGDDACICAAHNLLLERLDDLNGVYQRQGTATGPAGAVDEHDFREANGALVRQYRDFVRAARDTAGLVPRGPLRRLLGR